MPFVSFDQDYASFVRQAISRGVAADLNEDHALFARWLSNRRVRAHLMNRAEDRVELTPSQIAHLSGRLRKKLRRNPRQKFYKYRAGASTWQEIFAIRTMIAEIEAAQREGKSLPANLYPNHFALSSYANMLLRVREWDLWKKDEAVKDEFEVVARLGNRHQLVKYTSISAAIRDGEKLKNCMRQLAYHSTQRTQYLGELEIALDEGRIWSLWDENQDAAAALVVNRGQGIDYIFGECNGGLRHEIAMVLRRHVTEQHIPIDPLAALVIGLVDVNGELRPYETSLDHLFSNEHVDLSSLPIQQDELDEYVRGKDIAIKSLAIFKCANLRSIPADLIIEKGIRVLKMDQQPTLWNHEEANLYLSGGATLTAKRPNRVSDIRNRELRRALKRILS